MPNYSARYGWTPPLPDHRDRRYKAGPRTELPDLVNLCPVDTTPVCDQGDVGSCQSNAVAFLARFHRPDLFGDEMPSRLFLYYGVRLDEDTLPQDCGASIRDTIKAVNTRGLPKESLWPYDVSRLNDKPSNEAYQEASKHTAVAYECLDDSDPEQQLWNMRHCLAMGRPFAFGASVYESFEGDITAMTGEVRMPGTDEQLVGGHAMAAVGYHQSRGLWLVRNSWGPNWGFHGYCWFPDAYMGSELVADCWAINQMQ